MKNSNVRESPIARDTIIITDAESRVRWRVPKLLLECFMRQLHNELIASPDDGGLLGSRQTFFISNIVSIVSYPSKKTDQNEVHASKYLLQCSRSIAYH